MAAIECSLSDAIESLEVGIPQGQPHLWLRHGPRRGTSYRRERIGHHAAVYLTDITDSAESAVTITRRYL
jgi:hypothetical protein